MRGFILALAIGIIGSCPVAFGQTSLDWQTLPNAPLVTRHNDAFFTSSTMGWIVNGDGEIHRTMDGGDSWQVQFGQADSHFRSVGFIDALTGWAGNVGVGEFGTTDSTALYQTVDGGEHWTPFQAFEGPAPRGLCGMHVVNDSTVVAVGRVRGPSFFVKTTDGGETWISKDMSAYAAGLIDVYFFTPDTGIAVGLTNSDHNQSSGVILVTSDGGETWETRFTTTRTGEWCWKISFPSDQVGYVSLQRNAQTPIYFLKTTDGGASWDEKLLYYTYYFVQGIGFIDEMRGWIGGNSSYPALQTTDGGETWYSAGFGSRINRFRFLGDSLGYAVGSSVYKYAVHRSVNAENSPLLDVAPFVLHSNFPNPFFRSTTIEYTLTEPAPVIVSVFDVTGRRLRVLIDSNQPPGQHRTFWDGRDEFGRNVASGVYFYSLETGGANSMKKMILLR